MRRTQASASVRSSRHDSFSSLTNANFSTAGQVGKVLGEKWKALNSKQREPYEAKAKADKERYESEKASYNNVDDEEED